MIFLSFFLTKLYNKRILMATYFNVYKHVKMSKFHIHTYKTCDFSLYIHYNEPMIKIIFFDIDGTLITLGGKDISNGVKQMLNNLQKKGIKLFIATGRPACEVPNFEGVHFDGILSFNGQYCMDDKEVIYQNPLDPNDIKIIITNAKQNHHFIQAADAKQMKANGYEANLEEYFTIANQKLYVSDDFDSFIENDIFQMMAAVTKDEYEALLKGTTKSKVVSWWPKACDIIPINGGKGIAVQKILEHYNYTKEESMAFGDGGNDIEMLQAVGCGIAMGNAKEEVKEIADYITDSVENDGICSAIEHFKLL